VPLWNQFSRTRTGSLAVETLRTGSRAGAGCSEQALKMLWWKRVIREEKLNGIFGCFLPLCCAVRVLKEKDVFSLPVYFFSIFLH